MSLWEAMTASPERFAEARPIGSSMEGREEIVMRVKGGEFRFVQSNTMNFIATQVNAAFSKAVQPLVEALEKIVEESEAHTNAHFYARKALEAHLGR